MEYKPIEFLSSPRSQMDNDTISMDNFNREDPFNSFSELSNFDNYSGWCTSPSAADQMLASFALSAGFSFSPYELPGFIEQGIAEFGELNLPNSSENGHEIGNEIVQRPPAIRSLAEKMLKALSLFKDSSGSGILAQVWVPIKEGDKWILSTCEQPYLLDQALAGYREVSRGFTFSAEGKADGFTGLPGRVFASKVPEWTSNVAHYNKGEYLRIDHAVGYDVRGSIALPVFEDDSDKKSCCAVLELVTMKEKTDFSAEMNHVCRALETVNLKSSEPLRLYKQCLSKNQTAALTEITDVLRTVCHAHSLPVALTWIPCNPNDKLGDEIIKLQFGGCKSSNSSKKSILRIQTDACYVNEREMQGFVQACSEQYLEEEQGIAGKAHKSNHPFFFPDVKEYHISEYPLVQHARKYGLNAAVAIRLRSTYTGDDDYILEFFLPVNMKGSTEQQLLLNNLSCTMQRICRSLRTVSDMELSGVGFQNGLDESMLPLESPRSLSEQKYEAGSSTPADQVSGNATDSSNVRVGLRQPDQTVGGSKRQSEKKRSAAEKNVSLSVLQQYFSGSLKDAAKAIGVCPTTLKRICRQHGISRWPSRKINKVNRSLKKIQTVLDSVQGVEGGLKFDPTTGGLVSANTIIQDLDAQKSPFPSPSSCFEIPPLKHENDCFMGVEKLITSKKPLPISPITTSMAEFCNDSLKTGSIDNQSTSSSMTESSNGSIMNGSSSSSPIFETLKNPKPETLFGDEGSQLTVKATYKEDTIRFKFDPSSGWFQLYEEVAKRFKIQTGTFQLKYKDEEEEWVLLVCESDWSECLEILDILGTRSVKFLVRDATFRMGSSGSSNCFLSETS